MLCADNKADYVDHFKAFIKRKFNRNVDVLDHGKKLDFTKEMYLLVANVRTRIPEDVQMILNFYNQQGKI